MVRLPKSHLNCRVPCLHIPHPLFAYPQKQLTLHQFPSPSSSLSPLKEYRQTITISTLSGVRTISFSLIVDIFDHSFGPNQPRFTPLFPPLRLAARFLLPAVCVSLPSCSFLRRPRTNSFFPYPISFQNCSTALICYVSTLRLHQNLVRC